MFNKIRIKISSVLMSVGGLISAISFVVHPDSPEEVMMERLGGAMEAQVEEDLADIFGEFDENMVIDSPLVDDEDDFAGGGPGAFKEKNPSAEEFFDTEDAEEDWEYDSVDEFVDDIEEELHG